MKYGIYIFLLFCYSLSFAQFEIIAEGTYLDGYKPLLESPIYILKDNSILFVAKTDNYIDGFKFINLSQDGKLNWEYETVQNQITNINGMYQDENQDMNFIGNVIMDTSKWSPSLFYVLQLDKMGKLVKEKKYTLMDSVTLFLKFTNQFYYNKDKIVLNMQYITIEEKGFQIFECGDVNYTCHDKLYEYTNKSYYSNSLGMNTEGKFVNCIVHLYPVGQKTYTFPQINILDDKYQTRKIYYYYGWTINYKDFYVDDDNNFISAYYDENRTTTFLYSTPQSDTLRMKNLKESANLYLNGKFNTNKYLIYGHKIDNTNNCHSLNILVSDENLNIITDTIIGGCDSSNYFSNAKILDNDKVFLLGYKDNKLYWVILKYKTSTIEKQTEINTSLYPNPAKTNVSIDFIVEPENLPNVKVELYNLTGILQSKLDYSVDYNNSNGQGTINCNIENIPNGYYIITIDNGKRKIAKPFIVNRD